MTSFENIQEDIKLSPIEEDQMGTWPSEEVMGLNRVDSKPDYVEVKPEVNESVDAVQTDSELEDEQNDDKDSNFDIKEEENKESSDSDSGNNSEDYVSSCQEYIDDQFKTVRVKSYTTMSVKEEPIENLKTIFKESTLEFEKQKYHQEIFGAIIVNNSGQINIKDLQAEYLNQLHEAANVTIFTCSLCDYQTMNLTNLNCHLLTIHNGRMERDIFRCDFCNYEAHYKSQIKKHMVKHKIVKIPDDILSPVNKKEKRAKQQRFPCSLCSYIGRSKAKLNKHETVHKDRSNCDLCSFQSTNKAELQIHKDTHKVGKSFLCYMCTYKNTNKATLGRHLVNIHKIENEASKRSKMCEYCSFSCSSKNQLQIHYLTHKTVSDLKEDEIFKCPEPGCNHRTKLKCHLRVHMKTHRAPDFICEVCGFATRRKESYTNHLITHKRISEIEWVRCSICPYQARNSKLMRRHMRNGDHSGKILRHIRNRDRKREAEENGGQSNSEGQINADDSKIKIKKTRRRRKKKDMELEQMSEHIDMDIKDMDIKDHGLDGLNLLASLSEMT